MLGEREFTTEEVAGYCGVTRPAVVAWITRSLLPARKTAGGHRRVLRSDLARFLERQGYAVPLEVARVRPLLVAVEGEPLGASVLARLFAKDFDVHPTPGSIDALLALGTLRPDVLVLALPLVSLDGARLLLAVSRSPATADTLRVAVVARADEVDGARALGAEIAFDRGHLDGLYAAVVARLTERQRRAAVV